MRSTASLIILAFLPLLVGDARAQEQSLSLNIEGESSPLRRTPALVIHEVVAPTVTVKSAPAAALKTQGAPKKDAASKSSAAGAPSLASAIQPIVFPGLSPSVDGEMVTTGNPKYDELIALSAARNGVDPNLVVAMMRQESGFNPRALSYKGASGLMQLMPATARRFGVTNIFDAAQNIEGGTRYLRFLLDQFNGDVNLVLAGYNAGEHAVVNWGYQVPRYRETQNYVKSISARYDASKHRAASAKRNTAPVAPSAETFSKGRLSNNY
ncbi:MAG TPA: lytic transglycosylase domain-containing protein [Blastocatellia bacterium]|nr:lytic transglycosylase domain-containing protein [Blastocatellia bacterium]